MNSLQRLEHWGEAHHPRYLDILRVALGVFLFIKGIEFAGKSSPLPEILSTQVAFSGFMQMLLQHYIIFAHIAGGFMIATGLLTRVAAIAQIPILLGALIFFNWSMMSHFSDFILTLLILMLLVWFVIIGSGPWSLDRALDREELH
jgi:putative oxidoreductase